MDDILASFKRYLFIQNDLKGKISKLSLRFTDPQLESEYDQYSNEIHRRALRILIIIISIFEILWSLSNFVLQDHIIVSRDLGNWIEMFNTFCTALLTFLFPKICHILYPVYLPLVFCTNNLPKVMGYDQVTYDPASQILLWLMVVVPGIKFWRSCIISIVSIGALVVARLVQQDYGVSRVIFIEGASYLVYSISILTASRSLELQERELFFNIKKEIKLKLNNNIFTNTTSTTTISNEKQQPIEQQQQQIEQLQVENIEVEKVVDKIKKPSRYYKDYTKDLKLITKKLRWEFKEKQKETGFVQYYKNHVNVEVSAVLTLLFSSTYYLIQDLQIHTKTTMYLFISLRFGGMVPITLTLLYLSFLRKRKVHLADILSTLFIILLVGIYTVMFIKSPDFQTSLFYFGGVMRTLSFSATQCLLIPLLVQMLSLIPILPVSYVLHGDPMLGQILMTLSFICITYYWSFNREKVFRISFLQRIQLNKIEFIDNSNEKEHIELKVPNH